MLSFWLPYVVLRTTFLTKREEISDSFFLRDLSLMLFLSFPFSSFFFFWFG